MTRMYDIKYLNGVPRKTSIVLVRERRTDE
jgi:hypothetical protein